MALVLAEFPWWLALVVVLAAVMVWEYRKDRESK